MNRLFFLTALLFISISCSSEPGSVVGAETSEDADFEVIMEADGFEHPWAFAFLPDSSILITERNGSLIRYNRTGRVEIQGLPEIAVIGQGGLLDIILDPEFSENRRIYFSYSTDTPTGPGTAVARAELTGDALENVEQLFISNEGGSGGRHFGSRIVFAPDGTLFITHGERGERDRAQDPYDHAGSVLRINPDGSIPEDNPFVESGGAPEVYSYGHRNAQGMAVDPLTGEIWLHEHGPKGGDEINAVKAGANYGWPVVSYGVNYSGSEISESGEAPGMEGPLLYWVPSIAPSGMIFYTGDLFPRWKNDIFVGALAGKHLRRVKRDGEEITGEEVLLKNEFGRIRDVNQHPDGSIWFITDADNGGLYKIVPAEP